MIAFIARRIEEQAERTVELGIAKYRAYFIKTKAYAKYRDEVDAILAQDGFADCIVEV